MRFFIFNNLKKKFRRFCVNVLGEEPESGIEVR